MIIKMWFVPVAMERIDAIDKFTLVLKNGEKINVTCEWATAKADTLNDLPSVLIEFNNVMYDGVAVNSEDDIYRFLKGKLKDIIFDDEMMQRLLMHIQIASGGIVAECCIACLSRDNDYSVWAINTSGGRIDIL